MSTVVAVRKGSQVAIGADTLCMHGHTRQDAKLIENHCKMLRYRGSHFAIVGHAAWDLVLGHHLASLDEPADLSSREAIFAFALELHEALTETYHLQTDGNSDFESSKLSCLIAGKHGIFGLYSCRSVDEFSQYYALGAGSEYALGALEALYSRLTSPAAIARGALEAAARFDDSTGKPIQVRTVQLAR